MGSRAETTTRHIDALAVGRRPTSVLPIRRLRATFLPAAISAFSRQPQRDGLHPHRASGQRSGRGLTWTCVRRWRSAV